MIKKYNDRDLFHQPWIRQSGEKNDRMCFLLSGSLNLVVEKHSRHANARWQSAIQIIVQCKSQK